ncbi:hypothetical protein [Amycolatopsis sp. YIM 10]|uniref:hypothetical protein n=1 Tax=Amycolatopsis sp. YIM 10 TaxID=2653857 RepID=UPI00129054E7|nr:hypothetical protein [Amycolatopsis sp. YIM 10]QFU90364.1 hypothetical protein YIM_25950 [Amycolatopsis sp. YIM 10]
MTSQGGFQVEPQELSAQVAALAALGDRTAGLASSANRLAEQLPRLGTAPPALHLARRLREAAGETGLSGEVAAADGNLNDYHRALHATVNRYTEAEADHTRALRSTEGTGT